METRAGAHHITPARNPFCGIRPQNGRRSLLLNDLPPVPIRPWFPSTTTLTGRLFAAVYAFAAASNLHPAASKAFLLLIPRRQGVFLFQPPFFAGAR